MPQLSDEEMIAQYPDKLMGCMDCANMDLPGSHVCTKGWTWRQWGQYITERRQKQQAEYSKSHKRVKVTMTVDVPATDWEQAYGYLRACEGRNIQYFKLIEVHGYEGAGDAVLHG